MPDSKFGRQGFMKTLLAVAAGAVIAIAGAVGGTSAIAGAADRTAIGNTPSIEEANLKVLSDIREAQSKGDWERVASMYADDMTYEVMGTSIMSGVRTKAEILETIPAWKKLFKEFKHEVVGITAQGERVAVEARGHDITVTGVPYNNTYHLLYVVRDGKVKEVREYADTKLADQVLMRGQMKKQVQALAAELHFKNKK